MSLLSRVKGIFNQRSAEKESEAKFNDEIKRQERLEFEKEYRRRALEAAKIKAKIDAENKVGLAKLRAVAREQNMKSPKASKGFLSRLGEYTQANIQRREAMLERTAKLRQAAKEDQQRRMRENALRTKMNLERTALIRERQRLQKIQGLSGLKSTNRPRRSLY